MSSSWSVFTGARADGDHGHATEPPSDTVTVTQCKSCSRAATAGGIANAGGV
jgi:hypothetical protein